MRRIPGFLRDYLINGIGHGVAVEKNRQALNDVELMPRYLAEADQPNIRCQLMGHGYDAPFGVAPIGLSGLVWAKSETILAKSAKTHNIPYTLSTVANESLEEIRQIAGENAWFQLYTPQVPETRKDILRRCEEAGYDTIMVTVNVPNKREFWIRVLPFRKGRLGRSSRHLRLQITLDDLFQRGKSTEGSPVLLIQNSRIISRIFTQEGSGGPIVRHHP